MSEPFTLEAQREPRAKIRRGGWSWGPVEGAKLRVLSLGAGVQSTTLALMAAHGEIGPMPDAAIVADPRRERRRTYEHLRWLKSDNVALPFPIVDVSAGDLGAELLAGHEGGKTRGRPPFWVANPDGSRGRLRRQCTVEHKVVPLEREQRRLLGFRPRQRILDAQVEVWIGISTDEVYRAGTSFTNWTVNRYPLLELGMSRDDCIRWLEDKGYPVPVKSACTFCPFRSNVAWRQMRDRDPEDFEEACLIDDAIRFLYPPGVQQRGAFYVHRSLVPLREVDLSTAEDRGQGMLMVCDAGCGL